MDLSKRVFQAHAVGRAVRVVLAKALALERFFACCAGLPAGCVLAMEARGGAPLAAAGPPEFDTKRRKLLICIEAPLQAATTATTFEGRRRVS